MRKRPAVKAILISAAWCAVGGAGLWSISALADGIQVPQRVTAVEPPEYPALLGGPEAASPPAPVQVVKVSTPERDCITFERVQTIIGKIDLASVDDIDALIRDMQLDLGDDEWCEGVRETIKTVLIPPPPPPPEEPEPPVFPPPGDGNPPGGPGGPGYR